MSDLRHDPINDQWISIAKNRRERPMEFIPLEQTMQQIICPFCTGNEDETPTVLAAYREDGSPLSEDDEKSAWTARVIPNKFPSFSLLSNSQAIQPTSTESGSSGPFQSNHSAGIQELILPSGRHIISISELTDPELRLSFKVYQDRIAHAKSLDYVQHAMLFMNCRYSAGASIGHAHTQLIGSPVVGGRLKNRSLRNQQHAREHGCSLVQSLTQSEIEHGSRIIEQTENFCIVCPFASRFAFQIRIVPLKHTHDFMTCPATMRDELALHCRDLVTRLETLLDHPGYNLLLQIDPFDVQESTHWYFELFPRLTRAAGFEWGTDIWVNPVDPEAAARQLKART